MGRLISRTARIGINDFMLVLRIVYHSGQKNEQFFLREMQKTSQTEIDKMIAVLKDSFEDKAYDYNKIFFTGDDVLPRWAGYKLGYYFVKQYLRQADQTIAQATLSSYKDFCSIN
jgi:uncharacterized protein YjaZ